MSVYVPNYKHDIFISYARVDNEPFPNVETGWVTTFVNALKILLNRKLGRAEAYSLWMDERNLLGNESVTPYIDEQLRRSATFVFILSTGYFASAWCRLEFHNFLQEVGQDSGRLFMVQHEMMGFDQKLPELQKLAGYQFWKIHPETGKPYTLGFPKPNPDTQPEYYQELDRLASELADKLKQLQTQELANNPTGEDQPTSDLDQLTKSYLETEKANLEQKKSGLTREYNSHLARLGLANLSLTKRTQIKNQLEQLKIDIGEITAQITQIDSELADKLKQLQTQELANNPTGEDQPTSDLDQLTKSYLETEKANLEQKKSSLTQEYNSRLAELVQ